MFTSLCFESDIIITLWMDGYVSSWIYQKSAVYLIILSENIICFEYSLARFCPFLRLVCCYLIFTADQSVLSSAIFLVVYSTVATKQDIMSLAPAQLLVPVRLLGQQQELGQPGQHCLPSSPSVPSSSASLWTWPLESPSAFPNLQASSPQFLRDKKSHILQVFEKTLKTLAYQLREIVSFERAD